MKPTKEQINKCLKKICKQVNDDIHMVNWGGCGVFAVALADIVSTLGHTDFVFRVYSFDDGPLPDLCVLEDGLITLPRTINPWNIMGVYFNHIRMEWNQYAWDCEGELSTRHKAWRTYSGGEMYPGHLSYAAIAALINRKSNWNDDFDRGQIPKMKQIMYDIVHSTMGIKIKP